MSPIKVPEKLPELVKTTFNKARTDGDLVYFPTQVAVLAVRGVAFQLRFCPALASKPKAPVADQSMANPRSVDPFESPVPALNVGLVSPDHRLVLNKFAVVPEHFILTTTAFKPQMDLLEAGDLAAAYACITAYHDAGQELFAFFNSGDESGASQPHRHLQLLPVARMRDGLETCEDGGKWEVLAGRLAREDGVSLPFAAFAARLRRDTSAPALRELYLGLYRRACAAARVPEGDAAATEGEARISYNMAITRDVMVLCPRVAEGAAVHKPGGPDKVGELAVNGTVLAGTALVKNEAEWDALRRDPEQLARILGAIGLPAEAASS